MAAGNKVEVEFEDHQKSREEVYMIVWDQCLMAMVCTWCLTIIRYLSFSSFSLSVCGF